MIQSLIKKLSICTVFLLTLAFSSNQELFAASPKDDAQNAVNNINPGGTTDIMTIVKNVTNILLFIVGAFSVIMLIVGGIRYVMSAGDANAAKGAKDTIMYALIGVVVAFAAYGVVNWVINALI